jgi:hypothetical protein
MNSKYHLLLSITLFAAVAQPVLAMRAPNSTAASSTSAKPATGVIERGGTVTSFDAVKKIVVVDKVPFTFSATPVKINQMGTRDDKNFILKPGMQIRFNTSKENYSAQHRVLEIWVTKLDEKKPPAKPGSKLSAR